MDQLTLGGTASPRAGWRSQLVSAVRRDVRDLADDDEHRGLAELMVFAAHNVWAMAADGDRRGVTEGVAELRKLYAQADELRGVKRAPETDPLAALMASLPAAPVEP